MRSRGLALIIVTGVLGILAVLAAAFVTMAQLERRASRQRLFQTKAVLLARAGIEDALARLGAGQDPEAAANRYGGEDWDNSGGALHLTFEAPYEVYRPGEANRGDCPVRHAMRPSFPVMNGLDPRRIGVDQRQRGYTGLLAGDLRDEGNTFSLKVASGGFHVNGGDPSGPKTEGYNDVLRRMLGTLAEAIDREDGVAGNGPVDRADGEALVLLRPQAGWRSWRELGQTLFPSDPRKLDVLREYLLLHAWTDLKVIRPNALPTMTTDYPAWGEIRLAHKSYPGDPVPDFERLPVQPDGKVVGRAPVDLSWARTRRPALIALLADLKGLYLDETTAHNQVFADTLGTFRAAEIPNTWSPTDPCHVIAEAFLTSTTGIRTWDEFNAFCDGIPLAGAADLVQARKDILKANFNPNSDLNKFNPDISLARLVDKSDLLAYSTEFSLLPLGHAQLSAAGRILDARGRLLASARVEADVSGDEVFRITTQREFVAEDLGAPDLAGDEGAARSYGNATYITPSQGNLKAFGHKRFGFPGTGMSLQTLPEPHTAPPASYDGQVRLATIETADDQYGPKMMFLARWVDGFDADYTGENGNLAQATPYDALQATPDLSLWDPARPNTLHTDGVYLERGRQPGYYCMGNMAAEHGVLSFWFKPNFDGVKQSSVGFAQRHHLLWNATRTDGGTGGENTASLALVYARNLSTTPRGFGYIFEVGYGADIVDPEGTGLIGLEQVGCTPNRVDPPHQWRLCTLYWDERVASPAAVAELRIDNGQGALNREDDYGYNWTEIQREDPEGIDYRMPDGYKLSSDPSSLPPAVFHLGLRGNGIGVGEMMYTQGPPDATLDEFAIYDFGPADSAIAATAALIGNRFNDGRFYKESGYSDLLDLMSDNTAGRWFSAPVDLGAVRLKRLAWTQIVPGGLKAPLDPGSDGRILLELTDWAGQDYLKDSGGDPIARLRTRPAGERLDRGISSPFRLHAVFQPNLELVSGTLDSTPILDPLALDDVTVTYERPGGPHVLSWETGS